MLWVRFHHASPESADAGATPSPNPAHAPAHAAAPDPAPAPAGRMNLLLSHAGWQDESWADRLPRLLEPMGVRSIRASDAREASHVIATYRVHIAVVDLGLPLARASDVPGPAEHEESGPRLLDLLRRLEQPPPTVVIKRSKTARDDVREMHAALRMGAFAVVDRPRDERGLELMLDILRRCLARYYQGRWPGPANTRAPA